MGFVYEFKALNLTDYELILEMKAKKGVFTDIFKKASAKLRKDENIKVNGEDRVVDLIDVPPDPRYFSLLKTAIRKPYNRVKKIVKEDGIIITSYKVVGCRFLRDKDKDWDIILKVTGLYYDARYQKN